MLALYPVHRMVTEGMDKTEELLVPATNTHILAEMCLPVAATLVVVVRETGGFLLAPYYCCLNENIVDNCLAKGKD